MIKVVVRLKLCYSVEMKHQSAKCYLKDVNIRALFYISAQYAYLLRYWSQTYWIVCPNLPKATSNDSTQIAIGLNVVEANS